MNQNKSSRAPIIQRNEIAFAMGLVMVSALAAMLNFRFGLAAFYHFGFSIHRLHRLFLKNRCNLWISNFNLTRYQET